MFEHHIRDIQTVLYNCFGRGFVSANKRLGFGQTGVHIADHNRFCSQIVALLCLIAGVAVAARLENAYLPPGSATAVVAAGAGFVQAPGLFNGAYNPGPSFPSGSYRDNRGPGAGQAIPITRYSNQNSPDGSYRYNYQTANGITAEEIGHSKGEFWNLKKKKLTSMFIFL